MANEISLFTPLLLPYPPSGWRVLSVDASGVRVFRGPSGLTVSVAEEAEGIGRRVIVSRSLRWPTRLELEFVIRHFWGEELPFEIEAIRGLGPLAIRVYYDPEQKITLRESQEQLSQIGLLNETANARRDQSTMRASMARAKLSTPSGWRRRPSPLGPPVYDRDGFQVIVCENERNGERWATLSVGRLDRRPTLEEAKQVARLFLGDIEFSLVQPEEDSTQRKVLVLECSLGEEAIQG